MNSQQVNCTMTYPLMLHHFGCRGEFVIGVIGDPSPILIKKNIKN